MLVSKGWSMLFAMRFLLRFCSFMSFPLTLAALVEAFPDSDRDAAAVLEKYRAEHHIALPEDPKAVLSSEELMASTQGWL
jgi:hypothetical protein